MNPTSTKEVVALVFLRDDDKILLVRQNYGEGYWYLPGGVVEHCESITEAAIREVKEETSLDVSIVRVVGIYSKTDQDSVAITLEANILAGTLCANNEILECRYFSPEELPDHIRGHFHQRLTDFLESGEKVFLRAQ